jgi:hypothetical protein
MRNFPERCNEFPRKATGRTLSCAKPQRFKPWPGERVDERCPADFYPSVKIIGGPPHFGRADGKYDRVADSFASKQPTEGNRARQAFGLEWETASGPFDLVR